MKHRLILFIAYILALPGLLHAVNPAMPKEPVVRAKPQPEVEVPRDSGMVVVPGQVDSGAIKTPPKNIDPKIDDATRSIDQEQRKKQAQKRQEK